MSHTAEMLAPPAPLAGSAARRIPPWTFLAWACVFITLVLYACFLGNLISQSTIIPTHDQAAYVKKTYAIAEAIYQHPIQLLSPFTYFGEPAANRPPLMMLIAGLVGGPHAAPSTIGIIWLITRLLVLAAALAVLARMAGTTRFIPAAALAILAAPGGLTLHYNMYMMDQPFEAFGLLAFAWLVQDLLHMTRRTARRAALGTLLLFLVKPAGLVLVFPLYVLLARQFRKARRCEAPLENPLNPLRPWLRPYQVLAILLLIIIVLTPYGWAVAQQYRLGHRGYWAEPKEFVAVIGMIALLVPPWLLALAGSYVAWRGTGSWPNRGQRALVTSGVLVVSWWYLFNAAITYTLDPRVLSGAMPIAVVTALTFITRSRAVTVLATVAAALFFAIGLFTAAGSTPPHFARVANAFSPLPAAQKPLMEVGALDLARRMKQTLADAAASPEKKPRGNDVMIVTSDDFIELTSLQLAMRFTGGSGGVILDSHPWGSTDLDLRRMTERFQWFLTKDQRKFPKLSGDVWTSLKAIDALILSPQSPWHDKFEKQWEMKVQQPDLEDTVTFWRLREMPSENDLRAALAFISPYFHGTEGESAIEAQIRNP